MKPTVNKISKSDLKTSIDYHLRCSLCKETPTKDYRDLFLSTAFSLRDRMAEKILHTEQRYQASQTKRVYYLSLEFLIGRLMGNNLHNLGMFDVCREFMAEAGIDIEEVREQENDPGLGNGGLGRLAACFLDSMATLDIAGFGYGIHYEYGLFKQEIDNGYQREKPDNWLADLNPWEFKRTDEKCIIPIKGRIEHFQDRDGEYNPMWLDWNFIVGIPFDIPVVGYGGKTVNWLRLYGAGSSADFDIQIFNEGDYFRAVEQKVESETITKMLYPLDTIMSGRELRLVQEYFLVACTLKDIIRRYMKNNENFDRFPDQVAIQMNDTHPSLAVAELMRLLVDEYALPWGHAWEITQQTLAYTNHTVLAEALEKWPAALLERIIPRHLQIIYEINRQFLEKIAARYPNDVDLLQRMSLIEEGESKQVRMAHLALVGSHSVNGVSSLHTEILKQDNFSDFYALWPERFVNVTNGITQRRWLLGANPRLAELITDTIGDSWITDLSQLRRLEPHADQTVFMDEFRDIKRANKEDLSKIISDTLWLSIDPDSLFDIHIKRIHEYKRQLLKIMHIVHEYLQIIRGEKTPTVAKTFIFAGKAAPGYWVAKQIIKLIHNVGQVINQDRRVRDALKVVFLPDYSVSLAEKIIPAADLSEQISMAGQEASGTGNMKFMLNGALTVGTLDGANVEMLEEAGADNIFIFGLKAEEITDMIKKKNYHPVEYYRLFPEIRRVLDAFRDNTFCPDEQGIFQWIYHRMMNNEDSYFHLPDFSPYIQVQDQIEAEYLDPVNWTKKAILNVARSGKFSSDRAISDYNRLIWNKNAQS
ncbi:glycogen phosphorylase [Desulfobacter hydrogenophilus]|uniref:Alpha-1,4 glucan phosphorylase n=1 Tax=Desulfobacter hydrogenophilus TaxID=2291 RepID=A0A328FEY1_9BACT|nr:glycogen/starch/alpha-glucan phosphorylase [Desulfobacter hydrogenophilus]NDY72061.1 glycogen/starch/alpha-glucan phosphorylase [Desulfobacter hydrogenophilus]QBH11483.1 glycogen/starch/alpha-glucan phosphorylase [Desulfobacter hydrogenophilus]RAM01982.1 glycogen phosphorylase [Desulfobacter hydrogenophilus]